MFPDFFSQLPTSRGDTFEGINPSEFMAVIGKGPQRSLPVPPRNTITMPSRTTEPNNKPAYFNSLNDCDFFFLNNTQRTSKHLEF